MHSFILLAKSAPRTCQGKPVSVHAVHDIISYSAGIGRENGDSVSRSLAIHDGRAFRACRQQQNIGLLPKLHILVILFGNILIQKADVFNMRIIPVFLRQVFNTCDIQRRTDTGGIKLHDRIYSNLAAFPLPVDPGKQYAEQIPPPANSCLTGVCILFSSILAPNSITFSLDAGMW